MKTGKTQKEIAEMLGRNKSAIEKGKFCNATVSTINYSQDRYNCMHKFKAWIKSRLGISDIEKSRELRERYHNEMLMLVAKYRFSAYEIFQANNPKLFEKRKRGRKPKIK